jgi:hypothetical protein
VSNDLHIQDHPEYPFAGAREETQAAKWERGFLARHALREGETSRLLLFLRWITRYAFLEQIVQGEIRYDLPLHKSVAERGGSSISEDEGERLARAELELMADPDVPAMEILERLEDQGVKVITAADRAGSDAPDRAGRLVGFFFFDGHTGPAFGVLAPHTDARTPFALAHLLGHLVMDIDPYQNRACVWDEHLMLVEPDPQERRADRFARAFLMPAARVRTVLDQIASAVQSGETPVARMRELLFSIFAVPPALLDLRLEDLGLTTLRDQLRRAGVQANGSAHGPDAAASGSCGEGFELPERYLNLALACCHEKIMEAKELARFLEVPLEEAEQLLREAGIEGDGV